LMGSMLPAIYSSTVTGSEKWEQDPDGMING
jgi:hypothetical protein